MSTDSCLINIISALFPRRMPQLCEWFHFSKIDKIVFIASYPYGSDCPWLQASLAESHHETRCNLGWSRSQLYTDRLIVPHITVSSQPPTVGLKTALFTNVSPDHSKRDWTDVWKTLLQNEVTAVEPITLHCCDKCICTVHTWTVKCLPVCTVNGLGGGCFESPVLWQTSQLWAKLSAVQVSTTWCESKYRTLLLLSITPGHGRHAHNDCSEKWFKSVK